MKFTPTSVLFVSILLSAVVDGLPTQTVSTLDKRSLLGDTLVARSGNVGPGDDDPPDPQVEDPTTPTEDPTTPVDIPITPADVPGSPAVEESQAEKLSEAADQVTEKVEGASTDPPAKGLTGLDKLDVGTKALANANNLLNVIFLGWTLDNAIIQSHLFKVQESLAEAQLKATPPAKQRRTAAATATSYASPTITSIAKPKPVVSERQTSDTTYAPNDLDVLIDQNATDDSSNVLCTFNNVGNCIASSWYTQVTCPSPLGQSASPIPETDFFALRASICEDSTISASGSRASGSGIASWTNIGSNCFAGYQAIISFCDRQANSLGGNFTSFDGTETYALGLGA